MSRDSAPAATIEEEFPERSRTRAPLRTQRDGTFAAVANVLAWVHGNESIPMPTDEEMEKYGINGALRTTVHVMRNIRAANKQLQVELAAARAEIARTKTVALCDIERAKSAPHMRVRYVAEKKEDLFGALGAHACGQLVAIDVPLGTAFQTTYVECIHPGMPVYGGRCAFHAQVASERVMGGAPASAPVPTPAAVAAPVATSKKHKGKSFAAAAAVASTMP